jgi:hypothetical protein
MYFYTINIYLNFDSSNGTNNNKISSYNAYIFYFYSFRTQSYNNNFEAHYICYILSGNLLSCMKQREFPCFLILILCFIYSFCAKK